MSSYKFLAGGHYAKLSPSWRGFSTTIKHEASVIVNLIVALVVEEMARTKDTYEKGFLGLPVPICKKNNSNAFQNNNKKKNPLQNQTMSNKTTTFKNKRKGNCCVCNVVNHFVGHHQEHKDSKFANMIIRETRGTSRYSNL